MGFIISITRIEPFIITLGGMISFQGIALLLTNSREVVMQGDLDFLDRQPCRRRERSGHGSDPPNTAVCRRRSS